MRLLDFADDDTPQLPSGDGVPTAVDIAGEIDWPMVERVAEQLDAHSDAAELRMRINSNGGEFGAAFDLYVHLSRHRAGRKIAHIDNAQSGALLVAMAADERIASVGAPILLHSTAQTPVGRWTAAKHAETADFLGWCDANMAAIFADRTGHPAAVFAAAMRDEELAPLDWCLHHNLITEVRTYNGFAGGI